MKKGEMPIHQMKAPSQSLQRLWFQKRDSDPYINLANAIVCVAADDYRTALKEGNQGLKESLEQFFYSKWYSQLTRVKPELILRRLRSEAAHTASGQKKAAGSFAGGVCLG